MATDIAAKQCTPCQGGIPPMDAERARAMSSETPEWTLEDDATRIERKFRFSNFREALDFVNKVGELAEDEGHHPDVCFGWGYVRVSLQTMKIKGLHENDFILAAKIDRLGAG